MPRIYDQPVRTLLKEMLTELNIQPGAIISKRDVRDWFSARYPLIKDGTISAHLLRMSVNAHSRVHYSAKPGEDDIFYQIDGSHFRLYEPERDPQPIYPGNDVPRNDTPEIDDIVEGGVTNLVGSSEFAYEQDLQNFLSKNLHLIDPNLRLYEDEGITGIEFPVGGRFIDILAVDSNGNYVVIELKVSRGYDRVVGQLLRYISWIRKFQAEEGQEVRGVIIGRKISKDLLLACSELPNVTLMEYELSVDLKKVDNSGGT